MLKRTVLFLMILAMAVGVLAGCASSNQEDSAIAGDLIGNMQENADSPFQDQPESKDPQQPSADSDVKEEPADDGADSDAGQTPEEEDQTPAPDDSEPTPAPDADDDQQEQPQEQPPASENQEPIEKPNTNVVPDAVDPDAEDSGWYKVASYNIKSMWYDPKTGETGADMKEDIVRILREIDADIVGLQEVDVNNKRTGYYDQAKYLAEQLGYSDYYFTKTVQKSDGDYGHAILSRFPIKKVDEVEFKEQSGEFRKYTRAVLDVDGQEIAFFNVHSCTQTKLDNGGRDSTSGQQQFREVVSVLQKEKIPGVMTGDFNLPKETQFKLFDRSKVTSMNGGKDLKKLSTEISIDNIYVNKKMDYYVDGEGMSVFVGAETASDHDPLWSYFKLK